MPLGSQREKLTCLAEVATFLGVRASQLAVLLLASQGAPRRWPSCCLAALAACAMLALCSACAALCSLTQRAPGAARTHAVLSPGHHAHALPCCACATCSSALQLSSQRCARASRPQLLHHPQLQALPCALSGPPSSVPFSEVALPARVSPKQALWALEATSGFGQMTYGT